MPQFGAHLSIAGGYHKALLQARALGCEAAQIFTKAPNPWTGKPITEEEARLFRETLRRAGGRHLGGHGSYLSNLASPQEALYRRSVEGMVEEMNRAEALGVRGLVFHPGAHLDSGEEAALARVAAALDEVH